MTTLEVKLAIAAGLLVIGLVTLGLYHHHVLIEGEQKIEASDAKALDAAKKQADAETALNREKASKADEIQDATQKAVADYAAAHAPVVRVCHTSNSVPGVPKTSAPIGNPTGASAGPAAVPAVPDSAPGPDIGPGLAAIVSAAATVANIYRDCQTR